MSKRTVEAQLRAELKRLQNHLGAAESTLRNVREQNSKLVDGNALLMRQINCGTQVADRCENGDPQCYECALRFTQAIANGKNAAAFNAALDDVVLLLDQHFTKVTGALSAINMSTRKRHFLRGVRAMLGTVEGVVEGFYR